MFITRITAPRRAVSLPFLSALGYINAVLSPLVSGDPAGASVATLSVQNTDDASFAWSLLDDAGGVFQINATTGEVTLATVLEPGVYAITAQATGSPSGEQYRRTLILNIDGYNWIPLLLMQQEI